MKSLSKEDEELHEPVVKKPSILLLSVFVISTCGLVYELVAGTLASYVLGDSVTQFSTIIGTYLFAMGVGSYASRFVHSKEFMLFISIELMIALIGGFSSTLLFVLFERVLYFRFVMYFLVFITGALVGMEIPLLMRMLQNNFSFKELVSEVFTFDYIGALIASIIFPLFFVPQIGLIRTSLFFGILNALVAFWICFYANERTFLVRRMKWLSFLVLLLLILGFILGSRIQDFAENISYQDKVIFSKTTPYQKITLTRHLNDIRLYLNGNLQFSSKDEYRYHEALVHPLLCSSAAKDTVVVLGGGDGLAVREILKHEEVKKIFLIDLDPEMTRIFSSHFLLTCLNENSLRHQKLEIVNQDAFVWLLNRQQKFDMFIIDFPDPSGFSLGKLYSLSFYKTLEKKLKPNGAIAIQSTSPLVATKSFWCINKTLQAAGFQTTPYHVYVPSFGEWGYSIASKMKLTFDVKQLDELKFYSPELFSQMTHFPQDMQLKSSVDVNRLNNQVLVRYFEQEWSQYQ